jgi:hypothetical protein
MKNDDTTTFPAGSTEAPEDKEFPGKGSVPDVYDQEPIASMYQNHGYEEVPGRNATWSIQPDLDQQTIDVAAFVKAQAAFIRNQTEFLTCGRQNLEPEEYISQLTRYSLAQTAFIEAQNSVLHQLGVL